ncbi:hypothetical protein [Budvicia aquatica]|uniref:Uncharacterized protein n=1 Tax=Budvicia aquatica TaxID=82979 RepID=A0A484ZQ13_9GAMM|nr:hypothetical protein [Budvicia aquatica]VFS50767.1 Uncharacterised protein [Budvicia aquatica]
MSPQLIALLWEAFKAALSAFAAVLVQAMMAHFNMFMSTSMSASDFSSPDETY